MLVTVFFACVMLRCYVSVFVCVCVLILEND